MTATTGAKACSDNGFNGVYSGQPWTIPHAGAYTCGAGPHNSHYPIHFWDAGRSMW
jgi:hypothetical protein